MLPEETGMRWTNASTIMIALLGMVATAPAATMTFSGAPSNELKLHSGSHATWRISNTGGTNDGLPTGTCAGGTLPGLSVNDAEFEPAGANKTDAFDEAFALWVDDARFVAPDSVDVTDDTLTAGPVSLSGLEVTMEYRALQSSATLRALVTFHNPTSAFIAADVALATNYGSDGNTVEFGSGTDGGWNVTSDSATTPSDPPVLLVSTGSVRDLVESSIPISSTTSTVFACPAGLAQGRQVRGRIVVAPGRTSYLLQFAELAATNQDAVTAGATFETNPSLGSELMSGITKEQSLAIVNWNFFGEFDVTGGGATWAVDGTNGTTNGRATGGKCSLQFAVGITEAKTAAHTDAVDGGLVLFVDDQQVPVTASVKQTDQTVTVGPTTLSGLDVSLRYTALQDAPTLRTLAVLHNPTAASVTTSIQMATNVGSDNKTVVQATSSGDTTIATGDAWAITSDDGTALPPDVVNTHVFTGPGTPRITPTISDRVFDCSDDTAPNGVLATFALTLDPGQTQVLMLFNQLHDTVQQATDAVSDFVILNDSSQDEPLYAGLDDVTRASVVNWSVCGNRTYPDVSCRMAGLLADTTGSGADGPVLDKLLARLAVAKEAIGRSGVSVIASKAARTKRTNKITVASLKAFEKILKSKKAKTTFGDAVRTRLAATSAEIRATIKQLPLAIVPGV